VKQAKSSKPQNRIAVYLTADEVALMRQAAAQRRITASRYVRDLLMDADEAKDQQIIKLQRQMGGLQGDLRTVISMVDRLAELSSSPEDYQAWRAAVEAALRPNGHASGRSQ
jgi:hypothetical protein